MGFDIPIVGILGCRFDVACKKILDRLEADILSAQNGKRGSRLDMTVVVSNVGPITPMRGFLFRLISPGSTRKHRILFTHGLYIEGNSVDDKASKEAKRGQRKGAKGNGSEESGEKIRSLEKIKWGTTGDIGIP